MFFLDAGLFQVERVGLILQSLYPILISLVPLFVGSFSESMRFYLGCVSNTAAARSKNPCIQSFSCLLAMIDRFLLSIA